MLFGASAATPYDLRTMNSTLGTSASALASSARAPRRICAPRSAAEPSMKPGMSRKITMGRLNASHSITKWAYLSAAGPSIAPAMTIGSLPMMPAL